MQYKKDCKTWKNANDFVSALKAHQDTNVVKETTVTFICLPDYAQVMDHNMSVLKIHQSH